jgi:hypothetical protein
MKNTIIDFALIITFPIWFIPFFIYLFIKDMQNKL